MDKITQAITRLFDKYRIVFWYDAKKELRQEYETLLIPGVEVIELHNNEFGVKYHILREKPGQKFLLYHAGPQPDNLNNWLLDVLLTQGLFSADQVSLWMSELELAPSLWELVQEHIEFFKNDSRRSALKPRLSADDSHNTIRIKMLAVCVNADAGAENRVESVLEILLAELAEDRHEKFDLIQRCNLDGFLWGRLEVQFGYKSQTPGIHDFAIGLFKACYFLSLEEPSMLTQDALVFLKRWRDNVRYQNAFKKLSEESASILGIEKDLQNRDILKLIEIDFFQLIDRKILTVLTQQILNRTISAGECANLIWRRRNTHWFTDFSDIYEALYYGSQFINELDNADLRMESMTDGIRKYQNTWFRLDQNYRKFIFHVRASKQPLLEKLIERVENLYSNNFLLTVNDNWQHFVDSAQTWDAAPVISQSAFFERYVKEYQGTKNKLAVIISDALRYEIGEELARVIQEEDRYTAELEPMLTMLPSYTQLGMAALLPHQKLTIAKDGTLQVDGQSATGTENRARILRGAFKEGATAISASDLLNMNRDESRELAKANQVIYVYHDQIDATGDDKKTEERVFGAAQAAIGEIVDILKKLTNANLSNMIITADHGFIYQNQALDESEFSIKDAEGDEISMRNRRFVIGTGLQPNKSLKLFSASQLGLSGDYEVMIPKSINRLRQQGSGSRYVHGGAALQEVVIPLIKINKKRSSDTIIVEVDIITSSSSIITSGQISIAFYQTEPVSGKVLPRQLRAGIYSKDGTSLSDVHSLSFDLTSENPREREVRKQFVLSRKADDVNNQTVYLKLEEPVPGTSHYKEYKIISYQLRRSFTSDFNF
ncbi:MAG: BREX-1 system phosphatase PglZ type A [Chloroflexi bacterium]|nr:BREX-1 system phosphatase PglZ type A [Chloroflexota bacterium]